jgi:cyanate permease
VLLIVYYVVFMIGGSLSAYLTGLIVERAFGSYASLIVFLALYFLFLWIAWLRCDKSRPAPGCAIPAD